MEITIDTHSLIWYLDKTLNKQLSRKALDAIKKAEKTGTIYIPAIVLVEILYLIEKGRINYNFDELVNLLENNKSYRILPLDTSIVKELTNLKGLETHDRIILASSKATNTSLVSKDEIIRKNDKNVIW
jgi:PIN domain nuclease of toxin-antitoxin system